jgi:hypothetical protein
MKEHPILFKPDMVAAILDGRKTQTRRILKPQPTSGIVFTEDLLKKGKYSIGDLLWVRETFAPYIRGDGQDGYDPFIRYMADEREIEVSIDNIEIWDKLEEKGYHWRPSIHMHKVFCRLWLKVKNIRAERLQDITEEDAKAEGIQAFKYGVEYGPEHESIGYGTERLALGAMDCTAKNAFRFLWDSINGKPRKDGTDISWKANPWLWVISFEQTEGPK